PQLQPQPQSQRVPGHYVPPRDYAHLQSDCIACDLPLDMHDANGACPVGPGFEQSEEHSDSANDQTMAVARDRLKRERTPASAGDGGGSEGEEEERGGEVIVSSRARRGTHSRVAKHRPKPIAVKLPAAASAAWTRDRSQPAPHTRGLGPGTPSCQKQITYYIKNLPRHLALEGLPGPRRVSFAPGSHAPGLRLATHNIQGFANRASTAQGVWSEGCSLTHRTKVHDLVYLWGKVLRLHVVCVQETKLSGASRADSHTSPAGVEARIQAAASDLGIPGGNDIIEWWPSFKVALGGMIRVLNTKARTLQEAPGAEEVHVADRELVAAIQALELTAGSTAHSLQRVVEAKAQYVKALAAHSTPADLRARWQWLHEGERAAGHFKGVLAHANSSLTAVRTPGGGLATTPSSIASVLVAHYAHISADPVCDSEAVQHVLAAVRAHANPVDHDVASQAGAPQVSSIGNSHTMPHMFTWGAVCPISKSGDATSPANYRPITLLNTDYRVLARVLNARLVGVLGDSIGPEQSAFLPNRLIGDKIHFLQLLPAALRAQQGMPGLPSSAAVAFIDFAKAYDTISRPFLYAVIEAVGAGLLLSGAPSQGGFGLLPWKQHMLARHAVWACKLLGFLACDGLPLQPMQVRRRRELQAAMQAATPGRQRHLRSQLQRLQRPPHRAAWMSLTPLILLTASPHLHPAFHLLALARAKPGVSGNLPEAGLPGLLRRIVAALRGLGCPTDLTPELPLPVGPACSHIPVWGNPLLAMEDAQQPPAPFPQQAGAQALQWVAEWATTGFQELAAIPSLTNLSSLLHLCRVTQPAGRGDRVGSREWQRAVWGEEQVGRSIAVAVRANPARCATGLFAMWARLPTSWQQEVARQAPLPAPTDPQTLQRVAVAMVMDRLGWLPKAPPTGRAPAPSPIPILEGATVKCFTRVLMEPVTMLRAEANARFVKDALAGMWSPPPTPTSAPHLPLPSSPPATQAQGEAWLASRVPTLWKLPWLNSSKEVMWRLAVNGVPCAGGLNIGMACPCGWEPTRDPSLQGQARADAQGSAMRRHTFWDCPLACAVVRELRRALPPAVHLHTAHVWLAMSPCTTHVHQGVWDVVCLAALGAMWRGRRVWWARQLAARDHAEAHALRQASLDELWHLADALPDATPALSLRDRVCRYVVGDFWSQVQDFVALHTIPHNWPAGNSIPHNHPFICTHGDGQARQLRTHLPDIGAIEDMLPVDLD
ncbi:hypothetical protein QJQ45_013395, partial [Haematococcus lacustris]